MKILDLVFFISIGFSLDVQCVFSFPFQITFEEPAVVPVKFKVKSIGHGIWEMGYGTLRDNRHVIAVLGQARKIGSRIGD